MNNSIKTILVCILVCSSCPLLFSMHLAVEPFVRSREQQALQQDLDGLKEQLRIFNTRDVSRMNVDQRREYLRQKYALLEQILIKVKKQLKVFEIKSIPEALATRGQRLAKRKERARLYKIFSPINNEMFFIENELNSLGIPEARVMDHGRPVPALAAVPAPTAVPTAPTPVTRRGLLGVISDWWSGSKRK